MGGAKDAGRSAAHAYAVARRAAGARWALVTALVVVAVASGAHVLLSRSLPAGIVGGLGGAGAWLARPAPDPQRWSRGAAGERATAALLERLPRRRWVVLHDRRVPGSRANIDHLLVGPTGVWVVDSKAFRAPLRARWGSVWVGERRLDTGPAAWEADRVAACLELCVTPIVAIHGGRVAGLRPRGRCCGGVRVVPASSLVRRVRRGRRILSRAQIDAVGERADRLLPASRPGRVDQR